MTDINKYLEDQKALSEKNCLVKKKILTNISEQSIKAAEKVSRKQSDCNIKDDRFMQKINKKVKAGSSKDVHVDSESDYITSDDETEEQIERDIEPRRIKKTIDDGDKKSYLRRLKEWKNCKEKAKSDDCELDEENIHTADVRYILSGNRDHEESHEINNGLKIPNFIWKQLYKYQRAGVKWLWELHQVEAGGLLGDEMGLGKTVQVIAFLAGLADTKLGKWNGLGPCVIVTPATVIYQWVSHFHYWCPHLRVAVLHSTGSHSGRQGSLVKQIHESHGIIMVTYAGIVKQQHELLNREWHYIILDEGHKIRNSDTQVSKAVKKFKTPHKILVTGSPMQNNLQELWSLFDFMRPGLLGTLCTFNEFYANPITQGGYANASQLQEATALELAKSLKEMITPYMIRRTKAQVQEYIKLPEKNEQVLFCDMTKEQKDLYMGYLLGTTVRSILDKENKYGEPLRAKILVAITTLRKICNHPDIYLYEAQEDDETIELDHFGNWKRSGKMTVVQSLLKIWQRQGHRTLIFTQSRAMLCILEQFLQNFNYRYLKMDGSVSVGARQNLIKTFNSDSSYLVFLATTRVGGLGVNLTGADRVVIYDPDWNPATDSQAKERAWRIGQKRNVTVYRLLSAGTIEEKIYQRQIFKHLLSNKVLIDPNQRNLLKTSNLQGLFTLEDPNKTGDTETATIFSHTKVEATKSMEKSNTVQMSGAVSLTKQKMEEMRRRAKEISSKIGASLNSSKPADIIHPRERYKLQRKKKLNPPQEEKPEINLVNDHVTNVSFENALSEVDIVSKHVKHNYVENFIKETLKETDSLEDGEIDDDKDESDDIPQDPDGDESLTEKKIEIILPQNENNEHSNKFKRKYSSESDEEIHNLVAIKKVKKKKRKKEREKIDNEDEYVLSKLFAKSCVKNALEHDKIVGLAEKEEIHRLKEEASKQAKRALRALRKSRNNKIL